MRTFLGFLLVAFLALTTASSQAQSNRPGEKGLPFITNYSTRDYIGDQQNWAVVQDHRGVMYFGNTPGVLEFDGVTWRMIGTPNRSTIRSLAVDEQGRVYVGGSREFGYLRSDEDGQTEYVSLIDDLDEDSRDFSDVWHTFVTPEGIYFITDTYIYLWNDGEVQTWGSSETAYHVSFYVNGKLYIREWGVGLQEMRDGVLELVPGGDRFTDERIYIMLPYDDYRSLIGTRTQGFFLFDGEKFTPFRTEVDDFFNENLIYLSGGILPNGHFVIPSISAGVAIIDRSGGLVSIIDKESGLQDNSVLYTYLDSRGDLWLGLNQGVSRVELGSPMRVLDDRSGISSWYSDIIRFEGDLYGASQTGVHRLDPLTGQWVHLPHSTNNQTFGLLALDDRLLIAAGANGVYQLKDDVVSLVAGTIDNTYTAVTLTQSTADPTRIWVSQLGGIGSLRLESDGTWVNEGDLAGYSWGFFDVLEQPDGSLWVSAIDRGAHHISFPGGEVDWEAADVLHYGSDKGLSDFEGFVFQIDETVYGVSLEGATRYDPASDMFVRESLFDGMHIGNWTTGIEDPDGRFWLTLGRDVGIVTRDGAGNLSLDLAELSRLSNDRPIDIYHEKDVTWIAILDGIVRYERNYESREVVRYPTLIREVRSGADSVIFAGNMTGVAVSPALSFNHNDLQFLFANPSYQEVESNRYQAWLEGYEDAWSGWSSETRRAYTNLPPDTYTFHVKGRDAFGQISSEAVYTFEILPPWYRTWFAYGLYVVLFIASVFAVDRLQRRRLTRKAEERLKLKESQLRAEAAEANTKTAEAEAKALHAENERHKNIELLTEIGQAITATLSIKGIIDTVYENVNAMMDASVFAIGIYHENEDTLEFPGTREKGESLEPYFNDLTDENRLAPICFTKKQEIIINDWEAEHAKYVKEWAAPVAGDNPASIIYLPLRSKDKVIGVLSAQSFEKDAYTEYHVNILRNLATYAAIALDNAEAYDKLNATVEELNKTLQDLKTTQEQLVTQEKMASLGQLTAGIAHEIKNPLNFVNNFAELNAELAKDLSSELSANLGKKVEDVYEELNDMLSSLKINAMQIAKHGRRADSIVKNMMQHASGGSTERFRVEVNAFLDEYVGLSYHGMRAQTPDLKVTINKDYDDSVGNAEMAPQELGRVFLNLLNNAIYAVYERAGKEGADYTPTVTVSTRRRNNQLEVRVSDNGGGIPEANREKIFEPLFTTKPTGSGTGLGLSLSFDIVTAGHGGTLIVESEEGVGSTFIVTLPV